MNTCKRIGSRHTHKSLVLVISLWFEKWRGGRRAKIHPIVGRWSHWDWIRNIQMRSCIKTSIPKLGSHLIGQKREWLILFLKCRIPWQLAPVVYVVAAFVHVAPNVSLVSQT